MSLLSLDQIKTLYDDLRGRIEDGGSVINFLPVDNASGSIASFPDGADDVPVKSLIAQITPLQSGTGDPAPDNIRPISGWTGAKITRTGKNLVSGVITGRNISPTGQISIGAEYDMHYAQVIEGVQYTISTAGSAIVYGFFTGVPQAGSVAYNESRVISNDPTFTAPITGYVAFRSSTGYAYAQLEVGSTATAYAPYTGSQIDASWTDEGAVYGGTLTYLGSGKYSLQATHARLVLNGSESWGADENANGYRLRVSSMQSGSSQKGWSDWLATVNDFSTFGIRFGSGDPRIYAVQANTISGVTDLASWTTYLGSNNLTIVYPLATLPDPIILDAEDVKTLLGDNNIFVDTGDVSVDYRADIALYIQKVVNA